MAGRGGLGVQRQVGEGLRAEVAVEAQRQLVETVAVIKGGSGAEEAGGVLFLLVVADEVAAVSVEAGGHAQAVPLRGIPQVAQPHVGIVAVAIGGTQVAAAGGGLFLLAGHGSHGSPLPGADGAHGRGIVNVLFGCLRFGCLRQDIHLEGIHHFWVILVLHHHRAVQGGVFGRLLRSYRERGQQGGAYK